MARMPTEPAGAPLDLEVELEVVAAPMQDEPIPSLRPQHRWKTSALVLLACAATAVVTARLTRGTSARASGGVVEEIAAPASSSAAAPAPTSTALVVTPPTAAPPTAAAPRASRSAASTPSHRQRRKAAERQAAPVPDPDPDPDPDPAPAPQPEPIAADTAPVEVAPIDVDRRPAFLTIDATPYATAFIDGADVGETPVIRASVTAGQHQVRFVSPDGEVRQLSVTLQPGETQRLRVAF